MSDVRWLGRVATTCNRVVRFGARDIILQFFQQTWNIFFPILVVFYPFLRAVSNHVRLLEFWMVYTRLRNAFGIRIRTNKATRARWWMWLLLDGSRCTRSAWPASTRAMQRLDEDRSLVWFPVPGKFWLNFATSSSDPESEKQFIEKRLRVPMFKLRVRT